MRALLCRALTGPTALEFGELPDPVPGVGEVVIEVAAAGLNFADTLISAGQYQEKPALPFAPGFEAAGRVLHVGAGVTRCAPGQRVLCVVDHGAFATQVLARESDVFALPDAMEITTAAAFPIAYGSAHGALVWRGALQPGEWLAVQGAAGGVGLAAVEVGKALGARVIACARGAERLAVASAQGADAVIDYEKEDLRQRLKEITQGHGVDVVFDAVGGEVFDASLRSLAWGGRLVVVGFAGGKVPQVPANLLLVKNVSVTGLYWGSYRRRAPQLLAAQFEQLLTWYSQGKLKPHISHRLPFEQAHEALELLVKRQATGKVVLEMHHD